VVEAKVDAVQAQLADIHRLLLGLSGQSGRGGDEPGGLARLAKAGAGAGAGAGGGEKPPQTTEL
jgi:hypothetical protein